LAGSSACSRSQAMPAPEHTDVLQAYLDERRLLTTRVSIRPAAYHWVVVKIELRASPQADKTAVETDVLGRVYRYLNPLTGGADGTGWPFGRSLFVSDVYQCLQGAPDVQFVRSVEMYEAEPGGAARGDPVEHMEVLGHGVIASGRHVVEFV
jgi:hypothetical protein